MNDDQERKGRQPRGESEEHEDPIRNLHAANERCEDIRGWQPDRREPANAQGVGEEELVGAFR
jgi:hypothetical protein